jgi:hypothetical protein
LVSGLERRWLLIVGKSSQVCSSGESQVVELISRRRGRSLGGATGGGPRPRLRGGSASARGPPGGPCNAGSGSFCKLRCRFEKESRKGQGEILMQCKSHPEAEAEATAMQSSPVPALSRHAARLPTLRGSVTLDAVPVPARRCKCPWGVGTCWPGLN